MLRAARRHPACITKIEAGKDAREPHARMRALRFTAPIFSPLTRLQLFPIILPRSFSISDE